MCSVIWWLEDLLNPASEIKTRPTDWVNLQKRGYNGPETVQARWGFREDDWTPKPIFNARSETLTEKELFRYILDMGRAVLRISKFGEWETIGREKLFWQFTPSDSDYFNLACIARTAETELGWEFVLLTCAPNEVCAQAHDRMPCLLNDAEAERWLNSPVNEALQLLQAIPGSQVNGLREEPRQASLFDSQ